MSYPVDSDVFAVRPRPVLVLGSFQLTQFWFFMLLIMILLAGFGAGWLFLRLKGQQQARKVMIAQRDIINVFANIQKDIDTILEKYADDKIDESEISEIKHLVKKIAENLGKGRKYIVEDIGEIDD